MKGTTSFPQCGFSARSVAILKELNVNFQDVDVLEDPEMREGIKIYGNWPTVPQLYVNKKLIGGCDIMTEMYESGELKELFFLKEMHFSSRFGFPNILLRNGEILLTKMHQAF